MKHVFVIDDDANIRQLILRYLEKEGYKVTAFENAEHVFEAFNMLQPDALVLDIMMPGTMDGLDLCKKIRTVSQVPIIFVSAKDEAVDRIIGLELGADDYLSKPFSPRELLVRLKIIFRRIEPVMVSDHETTTYQIKDLKIDDSKRVCSVKDKELSLTNNEYMLLAYLVKNKNISFTRENLIQNIWGYDYVGESRMIDDLVKRLRKKLKSFDAQVEITTVWGYGYRIDDNF
ncbi:MULTISPECIES: response regulator transcription factor [Turicibacter]|jgi:response regulator receiver domain protein|uniref:response regulator transcription factor n=2 Tax=Turicibacteraceae TaxID=2810281 RepID=UPI0001FD7FC7|nr:MULTISPECIES: response regulator transcription factor [Turicibacter]EGC93126.1 putative transcriptional regulatory protein CssR [Turicibacter sp. HGF1]MBP3904591.1 response regulator transcription factor [Turicibacter sp.]MCU7192335.1 response regulator transcription factor [Turicibacter sanguinis]MCU7197407.1 response regulator transcription factor [Turicibacter sanguinis]MCU7201344.1 response regulator transcription factor [Turicibacter sanguinis]